MSMSMTNDEMLKDAAQRGDIDLFYTIIQNDPEVLQNIDSKSFIQTPLHTAAFEGHVKFATEIMRLKPSFMWKLNQQGYSPIHLAMLNDKTRMVKRFVFVDTNLVRVKGREGLTPLHLASQRGQIELLYIFLYACPNSIEDVTVSGETALHIAVKNEQFECIQLMVGWLKTTQHKGSMELELRILNWKDEAGNNILHISARENFSQAIGLLVNTTEMNLNAKNLENETALDMAANDEIKIILSNAGAKCGSSVSPAPSFTQNPSFAYQLRSRITKLEKIIIWTLRFQNELKEEQRQVYLIIATLVATATYQSMLSPPGGVFQANAGDNMTTSSNSTANNVNMTSCSNSTATHWQGMVGKTVMDEEDFIVYSLLNTVTYLLSILSILILSPRRLVGLFVALPVIFFTWGYGYASSVISPSQIVFVLVWLFSVLVNLYYCLAACFGFIGLTHRQIRYKNSSGGNIW